MTASSRSGRARPRSFSLTLLGTGTSTGVPIPTCRCRVCRSREPRNRRLRASAWLRAGDASILIDTSTDLRQQALRARIERVNAVLYTHPHADHIHGIDELRAYNFTQRATIPVYGNEWTESELLSRFPYIFKPGPVEGGGIPLLEFHRLDAKAERLDVAGVEIVPISLQHGSKECVGYRVKEIAYVTDCSYIPDQSLDRLKGLSVLILDCLRLEPHGTHFHLSQALETISRVKPKRAFLTHLGHDFDYRTFNRGLPRGVRLAYDGLTVRSDA
jgi:phosphoribosyl 1,2-cyclic phosphate phosphodiesterase